MMMMTMMMIIIMMIMRITSMNTKYASMLKTSQNVPFLSSFFPLSFKFLPLSALLLFLFPFSVLSLFPWFLHPFIQLFPVRSIIWTPGVLISKVSPVWKSSENLMHMSLFMYDILK